MWLKAPYIITLSGPPLKDHMIQIMGGRIVAIAPCTTLNPQETVIELPKTILLPGLVNAHCHLELSQLPQPLPYPGSFAAWIEKLSRLKMQMGESALEAAIGFGTKKLIEGGATTVADHRSIPIVQKQLAHSPIPVLIYLEVLGVERGRVQHLLEKALAIKKETDTVTITPHAPYSLLPEIFSKILQIDQPHPLSIHISESHEEILLFKENRGPLADFLQTRGKTPMVLGETPLLYLKHRGFLPDRTMAIHANYLEENDIAILHEQTMSVVHCPGSHAYFHHDRFPLERLQKEGINVALGTDSLASNRSLSMLEQMRGVLDRYPSLTPETTFKMATLHGAKALGLENEIGSLQVGKRANMIGIPRDYPKHSLMENILLAKQVGFMMIDGKQIL